MILEAEDETRDFITTYRKDYLQRKCKKSAAAKPTLNVIPPLNALNAPFKEYLNPLRKNEKLPKEERSEDLRDNLQRLKSKYPHLQKFLPADTPDEDLLEKEQKKDLETVYQVDYSKHLDEYQSLNAKKSRSNKEPVSLPEDWVIPETIQRRSYRNPSQLASRELLKTTKLKTPPNNLDFDLKEKELVRVRTGDSEYRAVIGATGYRIIKEKLFGEPLSLEPPQSIESESSLDLMEQKRPFLSNIF